MPATLVILSRYSPLTDAVVNPDSEILDTGSNAWVAAASLQVHTVWFLTSVRSLAPLCSPLSLRSRLDTIDTGRQAHHPLGFTMHVGRHIEPRIYHEVLVKR
jgi:hypothetical protein